MSDINEPNDPSYHVDNIREMLQNLTDHLEKDIAEVQDLQFRAVLETSREVLFGISRSLEHFRQGSEEAFQKNKK